MRLRIYILNTGLPFKTFLLATRKCIVKWDADTGEVSTIEYTNGSKIEFVWFDELKTLTQNGRNDTM